MKILHIMNGTEKFTKGVVDFYNESFDCCEHEICYLMKDGQRTCIRKDISITQYEIYTKQKDLAGIKYSKEIINLMKKYDFAIFHSFCINNMLALYLFVHLKYCRKHIIWIEWGADLYDFKIPESHKLKDKFVYFINKSVMANVNSVICIFPPDCEYFNIKFPESKSRVFYAPYMSGKLYQRHYQYQPMQSRLKETKRNGEPIYIQIGHNAQKQLNHLKALEVLSKFKEENIMLLLPLSYCADQCYLDQITKYLECTFPGKYIVLKDFMPKEEYYKIVSRVDIAIFYTYRQTGLGNIHEMIANNVKLFMPDKSIMKDYFCSQGIPIQSIDSIQNMSFEDFTSIIDWEKITGPQNYINRLNNYDERIKYWEKIYKELRQ